MADPTPPEPPNSDKASPELETLLAKARPIIAEERGLNHRSRVKIQAWGKKLKMSPAVIDQALQLLHGAPPVHGSATGSGPETQYEKNFAKVMSQKISAIPGRILTSKIEEKAVSVGTRKYQLSEARARNIVRQVAEEVGVPRVTLSEAERHIEQEVADVIGEQTWITGDKKTRLIRNGKRLGVRQEQVVSLIQGHLQFNFKQAEFERKLTDRLWIVAACIIVGTGFALFVFFQIQRANRENNSATENRQTGEKPDLNPEDVRSEPEAPEWWDDELKLELQRARLRVAGFPGIHDDLKNPSPKIRSRAYGRLFELGEKAVNPEVIRQRISKVIPPLYAAEPSPEAFAGMLKGIENAIRMPSGSVPESIDFFDRSFWALDLLNQIVGIESLSDEKVFAAQQMTKSITGNDFDLLSSNAARLVKQKQSLVSVFFEQLADVGNSAPTLAPKIFEQLESLVEGDFPEPRLQEFRHRFLIEFLRFEESNWTHAAGLVEKTILEATSRQLVFFIDLMESTSVEPLQLFLQDALAEKAGWSERPTDVGELAKELREEFEIENVETGNRTLVRREKVQQRLLDFHDRWANHAGSLNNLDSARLLVDSVYVGTLVWLMNSTETDLLDRLLQEGFPALDDVGYIARVRNWEIEEDAEGSEPLSDENSAAARRAKEQSAKQRMNDSFRALQQFRNVSRDRRLAAFRQIKRWAPDRTALDPGEAQILAAYLLARKREDEQQLVLRDLPEMRHWPRLLIAAADLLRPDNKSENRPVMNPEMCLEVGSQLLDRNPIVNGKNWAGILSDKLLIRAESLLRDRIAFSKSKSEGSKVSVVQSIVDFLYRLRVESMVSNRPAPPEQDLESSLDFLIDHFHRQIQVRRDWIAQEQMQKNSLLQQIGKDDLLSEFQLKQKAILIGVASPDPARPQSGFQSTTGERLDQLAKGKFREIPTIIGQIAENEIRILLYCIQQKLR